MICPQEEDVKVKTKTRRQEARVTEDKSENENSMDTEDPLSVLTSILAQVQQQPIELLGSIEVTNKYASNI